MNTNKEKNAKLLTWLTLTFLTGVIVGQLWAAQQSMQRDKLCREHGLYCDAPVEPYSESKERFQW